MKVEMTSLIFSKACLRKSPSSLVDINLCQWRFLPFGDCHERIHITLPVKSQIKALFFVPFGQLMQQLVPFLLPATVILLPLPPA